MARKRKKAGAVEQVSPGSLRRMSIAEASKATGISPSTIRRACLRGDLKFMRTSGGCNSPILIPEADLVDWLSRCEQNRSVLSPAEVKAMRDQVPSDEG